LAQARVEGEVLRVRAKGEERGAESGKRGGRSKAVSAKIKIKRKRTNGKILQPSAFNLLP
jgi:hypothetical protein